MKRQRTGNAEDLYDGAYDLRAEYDEGTHVWLRPKSGFPKRYERIRKSHRLTLANVRTVTFASPTDAFVFYLELRPLPNSVYINKHTRDVLVRRTCTEVKRFSTGSTGVYQRMEPPGLTNGELIAWGHEDAWLGNSLETLTTRHIDDNGKTTSFAGFTTYFGHVLHDNNYMTLSSRYTYEQERLSCITLFDEYANKYTAEGVRQILETSMNGELQGGEYRKFVPHDMKICALVTREKYRNRNRQELLETMKSEIAAWTKLKEYTPELLCVAIYDDRQVLIMERGYPLCDYLDRNPHLSDAAAEAVLFVIKEATKQCNALMMDTKLQNIVFKRSEELTALLIDVDPKFTRFPDRNDVGSCLLDINLTLFMLSLTGEEKYRAFREAMLRKIAGMVSENVSTAICSALADVRLEDAANLEPGRINQDAVARMVIFIALFYSARLTTIWEKKNTGWSPRREHVKFQLRRKDPVVEIKKNLVIYHSKFFTPTLRNHYVSWNGNDYTFAGNLVTLQNEQGTFLDLERPIWPQLFKHIYGKEMHHEAIKAQQDEIFFAGSA